MSIFLFCFARFLGHERQLIQRDTCMIEQKIRHLKYILLKVHI